VRGILIYALYRLIGTLTGPLSPRIGHRVACWVGRVLYFLSPRLRRVLSDNIRHVLGSDTSESRVQALTRQACVNVAKGHYDLFRLSRMTIHEIEAIIRLEGREHLDRALAEKRGVILISAHLGNLDLLGQLTLTFGVPVTGVAWHSQPERLFRYTLRMRSSHGLRLIPSDGPMIGLFRALKNGEIVCLAADRDTADSVCEIDFFGVAARLPDGPIRLALRTGAALVPAFGFRLPDDTFLVQIESPIPLSENGDREADVVVGMEQVVAVMERHISEHPEQWLVAVPVWPMN
jgi:lauroyl/myristoyl acyltransferase